MPKNDHTDDKALLGQALTVIEDLEAKVSEHNNKEREPIAVVGLGCRFPGGANNPNTFWKLLRTGYDAISEVPKDRWDLDEFYDPDPEKHGKIATRWGGFIQGIEADEFDAQFFNITPREAIEMDPQQRVLMEVAWQALENAGYPPLSLENAAVGIYTAMSTNDYIYRSGNLDTIGTYHGSGVSHSVAAGRISYFLGLKGPSIVFDTACASSLIALHYANYGLRNRECNMAIVGAVNMMISPETMYYFSKAKFMAPDGHCKTFDASADGYVRGEGCGCLVLKRLSDAQADGDLVYAIIRGSSTNHSGPSSGLTVPNGPSQQAVIRSALKRSEIKPEQVQYIEAHGTGTSLGDPIEMGSLEAVVGKRGPNQHNMVGSLKTNIGHLEAAAGMAGLFKVILALQNEEIPPHLGLTKISPYIPLENMHLTIPSVPTPWPRTNIPRIAGVSAFAFQGTNAHVVLEEAPELKSKQQDHHSPAHLLCLSARQDNSLNELAERYLSFLKDKNLDKKIGSICYTANSCRSHFDHRLAVVGENREEIKCELESFLQQEPASRARITNVRHGNIRPKVAMFFGSGKANQISWAQELYESQPLFREGIENCKESWQRFTDEPFEEVVIKGRSTQLSGPHDKMAHYVLSYCLYEVLLACGIKPWAVCGFGDGRYLAGCAAGVFGFEDGLSILWNRDRAEDVTFQSPTIPIVCNQSGLILDKERARTKKYWKNNEQHSFPFKTIMETLHKENCQISLGVEVEEWLLGSLRKNAANENGIWHTTQGNHRSFTNRLYTIVGDLYTRGMKINWAGLYHGSRYNKVAAPTYPFQRKRYWITQPEKRKHPDTLGSLEKLCYQIEWQEQPKEESSRIVSKQASRKVWLIFCDRLDEIDTVQREYADTNMDLTTILPGEKYSYKDNQATVNPTNKEHFVRLFQDLSSVNKHPDGAIYSWGSWPNEDSLWKSNTLENTVLQYSAGLLHFAQVLDNHLAGRNFSLWCLTNRAMPVESGQEHINLVQASLVGLLNVIGLEYPHIDTGVVDVDVKDPISDHINTVLAEAEASDEEHLVAFRKGRRYVERLVPMSLSEPSNSNLLAEETAYLVAGGLGGLGQVVTRWLSKQGAKHVFLVGRSNLTKDQLEELISSTQINIRYIKADITNADDVAAVFHEIASTGLQLRGIINTAGILDDGALVNQDLARFKAVLAPKIQGSWNLHHCSQECNLDFFIMFSSITSILGNPGQGNYATANAFCDAFAHFRQSLGLCGLSINWGPWDQLGMVQKIDRSALPSRNSGIHMLCEEHGVAILNRLSRLSHAQVVCAKIDWDTLLERRETTRYKHFLSRLSSSTFDSASDKPLMKQDVPSTPESIGAYLIDKISVVSGMELTTLTAETNIMDIGLDSLMLMEIIRACRTDLQLVLYPREFYTRPIIRDLADYLHRELAEQSSSHKTDKSTPKEDAEVRNLVSVEHQQEQEEHDKQVLGPIVKQHPLNPPAAFVLSPPRAGSTLLRVMLAGNPDLFCPPELHLLGFQRMQERQTELQTSYLDEGLLIALANATKNDSAEELLQKWIAEDISVQNTFLKLQNMVQPRLLVDKSPSYASSLKTLVRAEEIFDQPKYIFLIRHPYSVIESFLRMRMDKLTGLLPEGVEPFDYAESVWAKAVANVFTFFDFIAENTRTLTVRYEDLVIKPEEIMQKITSFLGINFTQEMLDPYQGERMVKGRHHKSLPIGDQNFLKHQAIDPALAMAWQKIKLPKQLKLQTQELSQKFGYHLPQEQADSSKNIQVHKPQDKPLSQNGCQEKFISINDLELCICSWGDPKGKPLVFLHGLFDQGFSFTELAQPLVERGWYLIAPDLRGHGRSQHAGSYLLTDYLDDINKIVRMELDDRSFSLIAHSMGTAISVMLANARPEAINQLFLVEPVVPLGKQTADDLRSQLQLFLHTSSPNQGKATYNSLDACAQQLCKDAPLLHKKTAFTLAKRNTISVAGGYQWRWDESVRRYVGIGSGLYNEMLLSDLSVPTTIILGKQSTHTKPQDAIRLKKLLPKTPQLLLNGGHNLHLEAAQEISRIIESHIE